MTIRPIFEEISKPLRQWLLANGTAELFQESIIAIRNRRAASAGSYEENADYMFAIGALTAMSGIAGGELGKEITEARIAASLF